MQKKNGMKQKSGSPAAARRGAAGQPPSRAQERAHALGNPVEISVDLQRIIFRKQFSGNPAEISLDLQDGNKITRTDDSRTLIHELWLQIH